jgi:hypothetical protein
MEIYEYKSYDEYVKSQIKGNLKKIEGVVQRDRSYADKKVISDIVKIKSDAKNVLCHGTRNAKEQIFFQKCLPDAYVIGSEISTNASEFPMTVEHDFNKVKEEWVDLFDIVYSNSFDHSITPFETLEVWRDQLNEDGMLFIDHSVSKKHHVSNEIDPLKIETSELKDLIDKAGMKIVNELKGSVDGYVLACIKK